MINFRQQQQMCKGVIQSELLTFKIISIGAPHTLEGRLHVNGAEFI